MESKNLILNRLFTKNTLRDLIVGESGTYLAVVKRYVRDPENKENLRLISEIYNWMGKEYRNEYFYQNTLFNKLLLGKHSLTTTTALTQIPIGKSKADFIMINGKAVVYEIKTELDTFERLERQITDYYKAFDHVCVVTSEVKYEQLRHILRDSPVGIYVLNSKNMFSRSKRKEPEKYANQLEYEVIFKVLHKDEQERILLSYYGNLPKSTQAFYFGKCLEWFSQIPMEKAYLLAIDQLKKRNKISIEYMQKFPYELKSLGFFSGFSDEDVNKVNHFLSQLYGG
ncbi:MAG: sce7726 family protein [Clostridia bacterium]|nr:sce7726 family protein [Clostridia bacterium]